MTHEIILNVNDLSLLFSSIKHINTRKEKKKPTVCPLVHAVDCVVLSHSEVLNYDK